MPDSAYHQDRRPQRSLLAFRDQPWEGEDEPGFLSADAGRAGLARHGDAALRHRHARAEREAAEFQAVEPDYDDPPEDDPSREEAPAPGSPWPRQDDPVVPPGRSGFGGAKRLIAACGLAGAVAGGLVALSLPLYYDATAELRLDDGRAPLPGIEDQLRVAASGLVLNKVVDKLGLADDPDFNGAAGDGGLVPFVRSLLMRNDGAAASDAGHRHTAAAGRLADSLSIGRGSAPATIAVTARTGNGEKSALIANTVADAFLDTAATMRPVQPAKAVRQGADDGAARRLEVFLANHGLASADAGAAADALLKLDDQLSAARARTAGLKGRIAAMRALDADSAVGGGLPQEFETGAMGELRAQYLAIKRESDRAAARLGPRNPERIALDTQLAGARDRIAAELRRIAASLQNELRQAVEAEQGLSARLAETKLGADDIAALRGLAEAASRAAAAGSAHIDDETTASTGAPDRPAVLTRAYAPIEASGPPRLAITLTGLLLGLGAGAGLAGMRGARRKPAEAAPEAETAEAGAPDPIDTDETPCPPETAMYPVYSDPFPPHAPQQPGDQPQQQQFLPAPAPRYYAAQPMPMQPMPMQPGPMQPGPPMAAPWFYAPYPPVQPWQMQQPVPAGYYPYPQPGYAPRADGYPQPMPAPAMQGPAAAADPATLEEIRASLREFREAVRELAESRARRAY